MWFESKTIQKFNFQTILIYGKIINIVFVYLRFLYANGALVDNSCLTKYYYIVMEIIYIVVRSLSADSHSFSLFS